MKGRKAMKTKYMLLSSAPNLELIKDSIKRYFCGEDFELKKRTYEKKDCIVIYKNNTCLEDYRIFKQKNRYRFEVKEAQ